MDPTRNVYIAWMLNLFQTQLTFHSITFCNKRNSNVKEFIPVMLSVITVYLHHKSDTRSTQDANIMNLTQKPCVTNVFLLMSSLKDSNTDTLIMFSLWILIKFKDLLNIGFRKNTLLNKELDTCTDIMLKIHIIREVSESLLRPFMNLTKSAHTVISQSKIPLQN